MNNVVRSPQIRFASRRTEARQSRLLQAPASNAYGVKRRVIDYKCELQRKDGMLHMAARLLAHGPAMATSNAAYGHMVLLLADPSEA